MLLKLFPEGRRAVDAWIRARRADVLDRLAGQGADARRHRLRRPRGRGRRLSLVDPAEIRRHHLRHSFLTWIAVTTNNRTVQLYGQHQDLERTHRYMRAAVPQLAEDAVARAYAQIAR